ncbi:hypothetical protein SOVF_116180 [Spinacia oleracea]|uniref:CBF1-interacting co-repressor CIR N-terminal domain-containing protein n=1 Tax=Spinacia oleracea TaxID=3562 RepID=A0A9R0IHC4_SPIOL|nr:uncharacterized protein LOC110788323 [Spinacia oleracea]KNA13514.1 hypothetical protein SOVF_116180 [Spinacia oleracea]
MGGHGGLNILPQKKWNVYNFDNREKVRKDEEDAAREEQLKRDQSRKRDSELRLNILKNKNKTTSEASISVVESKSIVKSKSVASHYVVESKSAVEPKLEASESVIESKLESESRHINLFDGIKIFDPVEVVGKKKEEDEDEGKKRKKKKEEVRVVGPEDEVYRLGYGVAGKGVKAPWYTMRPGKEVDEERDQKKRKGNVDSGEKTKMKKTTPKTVEELREERLKREKAEKERERALLSRNRGSHGHYPIPRDRYRR